MGRPKKGRSVKMITGACARNLLLLGMSLMLLATAGCGDGPESEPVRQPPVLRKKITMPEEPQAGPTIASKAKPVTVASGDESAQEGGLLVKDPKETPRERKIMKEIPAQPTMVAPAPEEKRPPPPTAPETQALVSKPLEKATEDKTEKGPPHQPAKVEPTPKEDKPLASPEESVAEGSTEGIETASPYEYSAVGKIDPFQPLFQIKAEPAAKAKKEVKKKRLPLTPLQKISLGQLRVVGIIESPAGNKALVEEPGGKGFIVSKDTYIGQNFGQVKEILKDRIIVEEEVEDILSGKMKLKKTELSLHKEAGDM
ncbi:MAG: pilus assembly protein PilP [Thermodesulfobacteriota bacterium]|nr:pilus assembly protein PilP [Thermodesulfobacteriota bacterium]